LFEGCDKSTKENEAMLEKKKVEGLILNFMKINHKNLNKGH
jgi:hypothetical protein